MSGLEGGDAPVSPNGGVAVAVPTWTWKNHTHLAMIRLSTGDQSMTPACRSSPHRVSSDCRLEMRCYRLNLCFRGRNVLPISTHTQKLKLPNLRVRASKEGQRQTTRARPLSEHAKSNLIAAQAGDADGGSSPRVSCLASLARRVSHMLSQALQCTMDSQHATHSSSQAFQSPPPCWTMRVGIKIVSQIAPCMQPKTSRGDQHRRDAHRLREGCKFGAQHCES